MFRPAFVLIPLALLTSLIAACSTPQERCIKHSTKEQRQLLREIARHEQNIDRGYAIHTQTIPTTYWGYCRNRNGDSYSCMRSGFQTLETPVAIDVAEERRKVKTLKDTMPLAQARAADATEQCRATYTDAPPPS